MATISVRTALSSLAKKGFREQRGRKHRIFRFYHGDTATGISTMVSRSSQLRNLSDHLISDMARQCKLTRQQFLNLARCPMSGAEYLAILMEGGDVGESSPE